MNRLTPVLALLVGLPVLVTAQSGTVLYDQATRLDFNLPANSPFASRIPKNTVQPMQLTFSPEATLFGAGTQAQDGPGAGRDIRFSGGGGGGEVMVTREISGGEMMMAGRAMGFLGGGPGSDAISGAYTDLSDGSYTEMRDFLGRVFRIPAERPTFAWKMTGEQAMFLGHPVYQAIAQQDSTTIEAWFTPDIPIPAGPAQYGGLPGLILTLAVDSNRVVYTATAIDTTTAVKAIKAPSEGSKVTREEYDRIVKDKMAELEKSRRGRRN
ncbi:MAG: GLPGLI family protein [Gemmatimonadota bacterium]